MDKNEMIELIKDSIPSDKIKIDEPMSKHTTFRTGGNADVFIVPDTSEHIISVFKICTQNNIPLFVIGNGSNILVRDKGIRGVVAKIYDNYAQVNIKDNIITAQSGILLSKISKIALDNNLSGLEFAEGIPGTLGGAIMMNAGAYGGEMKDIVIETTYIDSNGNLKKLEQDEHDFGYRKSFFNDKNYIILESKLKLDYGEYYSIKSKMDEFNKKRREKQPLQYPSAGSTFKRPEGYFAGKLIDDCGLKGYSIGGAQVSELHAGFIVNKKNATSEDIIKLITYVKQKVNQEFGVNLETEVQIIGEE